MRTQFTKLISWFQPAPVSASRVSILSAAPDGLSCLMFLSMMRQESPVWVGRNLAFSDAVSIYCKNTSDSPTKLAREFELNRLQKQVLNSTQLAVFSLRERLISRPEMRSMQVSLMVS